MRRLWTYAGIGALAAVGAWTWSFLSAAGIFLDVPAKSVGVCRSISGGGIAGIEDLAIDPETRVAYLSGYDRWAMMRGERVRGAIWTYALDDPDAVPVDVTGAALANGFHPHGISLYRGPDGKKVLFVINHFGGRHTVEIFDVEGAGLAHRMTIEGEGMVSPNDLVGTDPRSFYVTNDHLYPTGFMRMMEDFLWLRVSNVLHFDGTSWKTVIDGVGGANGINMSADGRSVYVAAMSERAVRILDRDPTTNEVTPRAVVEVPGYADNIDVEADGSLLLGLHTKVLAFLGHAGDETRKSPSHIMRLISDGKGGFAPQTIHYSDGTDISAASVGASVPGRLLVGAVFDRKIMDCVTAP
jgi:arylesterase/paraoxonase